MDVRSVIGSLQVPVAAAGALLVVFSVGSVVSLPAPPPESEGFVRGLAVLVLYVLGWVGFLLTALGLAIPPGEGYGIAFNRYQRGLFVLAGVAAVASAVGPFVAFGLLLRNPSLMANAWVATMGVALLALTAGLVWRGIEAVRTWRTGGGPASAND